MTYVATVAWSWWVAMSVLEFNDGKLAVIVVLSLLFLMPPLMPIAPNGIRKIVNLGAACFTLLASAVLTTQRLSPILIAPVVVYVVAVLVSDAYAQYVDRRPLGPQRNEIPQ